MSLVCDESDNTWCIKSTNHHFWNYVNNSLYLYLYKAGLSPPASVQRFSFFFLTASSKLLQKNPAETCNCTRKLQSSHLTILSWQFVRKPLWRSVGNYFQRVRMQLQGFPFHRGYFAAPGCLKSTVQTLVFLQKPHRLFVAQRFLESASLCVKQPGEPSKSEYFCFFVFIQHRQVSPAAISIRSDKGNASDL